MTSLNGLFHVARMRIVGLLIVWWLAAAAAPSFAQTTIVHDSFTGTDGTPIAAHAPEINRVAGVWTVSDSPPAVSLGISTDTLVPGD